MMVVVMGEGRNWVEIKKGRRRKTEGRGRTKGRKEGKKKQRVRGYITTYGN